MMIQLTQHLIVFNILYFDDDSVDTAANCV